MPHCQQAFTCLLVELICEKMQRMLKFSKLNWRKRDFMVKVGSAEWPIKKHVACVCVLYSTSVCLCQLHERVKMHTCLSVCLCVCVMSRRRRGTLWPGDNSDEWPRQVSNEALVTDWERTLRSRCTCAHFSSSMWRDWTEDKGINGGVESSTEEMLFTSSYLSKSMKRRQKCCISFITFVSKEHWLNMQNPVRLYASKVTLLGVACAYE